LAELGRAIGKNEDADAFEVRVELARASFQNTLFDEAAGIYRDGVGTDHSSIHANFRPLAFGLVPDDKRAGVVEWLEERDIQCSVTVEVKYHHAQGPLARYEQKHTSNSVCGFGYWRRLSRCRVSYRTDR
jgi:hypothetical protein